MKKFLFHIFICGLISFSIVRASEQGSKKRFVLGVLTSCASGALFSHAMNSTPEERSAQFGMAAILGTPGAQSLTQAVQLHGRMRPLIEENPARKVLTTPIGATSLYLFYMLKREHTQTVRKAAINVLSFAACATFMHSLEQSQQK